MHVGGRGKKTHRVVDVGVLYTSTKISHYLKLYYVRPTAILVAKGGDIMNVYFNGYRLIGTKVKSIKAGTPPDHDYVYTNKQISFAWKCKKGSKVIIERPFGAPAVYEVISENTWARILA